MEIFQTKGTAQPRLTTLCNVHPIILGQNTIIHSFSYQLLSVRRN